MANDELATKEFQEILTRLNRKYEMIHAVWSEEKNFEAKFRTQIPRQNDDFNALCDEWVDLFSDVTNTVWAKKISNTGPKIRFRKQYQCWTHGGKVVQKDLLFDARRCKGTLDMKVLTDNPLTRRKNKHIRVGLNVVVKINFNHLHLVDTRKSYAFFVHQCEPLAEAPKLQIQPNERLPQLVAEMVQKGLNCTQKLLEANNAQKILDMNNQNACNQSLDSSKLLNTSGQKLGMFEVNKVQRINNSNIKINNSAKKIEKTVNHPTLVRILENKISKEEDKPKAEPIYIPLSTFHEPPDDASIIKVDQTQQFMPETMQLSTLGQQTIMVQNLLPIQNMETVKLEVQPQLQPFTQLVVSGPQIDMSEHLLMFDTSQVIPLTTHSLNSHFVQLHNIHNQGQFL